MSEPYYYPDMERLSDCCTAPSAWEIVDGLGICSKCKEHATFLTEEEANEQT